ncbi:MAG: DUF2779 domain-containing protein [Leptospiraceae bacterium]|nr:DUF2779 domain-containing protein [Leptospiraceae bacterium]
MRNVIDSDEDSDRNIFLNYTQNEELESLGRRLYPSGEYIEENKDHIDSLTKTRKLVEKRSTIYNAQFQIGNLSTSIEILHPSTGNFWEVVLIKNSSHKKPDAINDLAFQKYVAELCGLNITECTLYTVNSKFIYNDKIESNEILTEHNVTNEIINIKPEISSRIAYLQSIISTESRPSPTKDHSCSLLKECRSRNHCYKEFNKGNIHQLRESSELAKKLLHSGINKIEDITNTIELTSQQKIQIEAHKSKQPQVKISNIEAFLRKIRYPIHFLDFETINPTIPIYPNTSPFEHIPFLYSLHILYENGDLSHMTYIEKSDSDPRIIILKNLKDQIESNGTILCYNDMIERGCLRSSVKIFSDYQEWFTGINTRFEDISKPFKNLDYYHPLQKGSASLKSIVKPLISFDYSKLKIQGGANANLEYLKLKLGKIEAERKDNLLIDLVEYCTMDTLVLVKIFQRLKELINKNL